MKNSEQPAYPLPKDRRSDHPYGNGLTKREYFAAMAMQGMLANSDLTLSLDKTCELSIFYADELLKQLES